VVVLVVLTMVLQILNFLLKTVVQVVALQQYEMRLVVVQQLLVKEMTVVTVQRKIQTTQAEEVVEAQALLVEMVKALLEALHMQLEMAEMDSLAL
jgi:hypothetical protein